MFINEVSKSPDNVVALAAKLKQKGEHHTAGGA